MDSTCAQLDRELSVELEKCTNLNKLAQTYLVNSDPRVKGIQAKVSLLFLHYEFLNRIDCINVMS